MKARNIFALILVLASIGLAIWKSQTDDQWSAELSTVTGLIVSSIGYALVPWIFGLVVALLIAVKYIFPR